MNEREAPLILRPFRKADSMTNRKNSLLLILRRALAVSLLLLSIFTLALAERHERVVDSWRPVNYDVVLTLNDQLTEIDRKSVV